MLRSIGIFSLLFSTLALGALIAQEEEAPVSDVTVVISGNARAQLKLAVPNYQRTDFSSTAATDAANRFEATLKVDLAESGIFRIQDSKDFNNISFTGEQERDFEVYRSVGNEILLSGEISQQGEKLVVESRVYELKSAQYIFGKRYSGTFDLVERIAHTLSDEMVLNFTGRRGISLTTLAFYSDRDGHKEIYLMDYDGSNQHRISGHQSISLSPDWSPLGDAIAYTTYFSGQPGVYLVDINSGDKIAAIDDGSLNSSPSFSPDGQWITFSRSISGNPEIFVARRDGTGLKRLTHSSGIDTNPSFSPGGQEIAFTSNRGGNPHIYLMDREGTNLRRVSFEGKYNDGASWSPDGSKIAYASRRRGRDFDIVITDIALLETEVLTTGPGSHEAPSFSPDGRKVVYTSSRFAGGGSRTQIFTMDSTGGNTKQLTTQGNNLGPDWSPFTKK